eukprot:gene8002-1228_t
MQGGDTSEEGISFASGWLYYVDGVAQGPLGFRDLSNLYADGAMNDNALVQHPWTKGPVLTGPLSFRDLSERYADGAMSDNALVQHPWTKGPVLTISCVCPECKKGTDAKGKDIGTLMNACDFEKHADRGQAKNFKKSCRVVPGTSVHVPK